MTAREAAITEIKLAPESLVQEAYDYILLLKSRTAAGGAAVAEQPPQARPDFLARQAALFGSRVLPDSQADLDELRAERF